jgi:hypothetical protein
VTLNPDPDGEISLVRAARQPVALGRATAHLRVRPQELNHCRHCVVISAKAFTHAAAVQRLPGPSDELPPDPIGHQELPSMTRLKLTYLPVF